MITLIIKQNNGFWIHAVCGQCSNQIFRRINAWSKRDEDLVLKYGPGRSYHGKSIEGKKGNKITTNILKFTFKTIAALEKLNYTTKVLMFLLC